MSLVKAIEIYKALKSDMLVTLRLARTEYRRGNLEAVKVGLQEALASYDSHMKAAFNEYKYVDPTITRLKTEVRPLFETARDGLVRVSKGIAEQAQLAEQQRVAAEQAQLAEQQRVAAEQAQLAEQQRVAAEQAQLAEQQRVAAEQAQLAEQQRVAAEQAQLAEQQRVAELAQPAPAELPAIVEAAALPAVDPIEAPAPADHADVDEEEPTAEERYDSARQILDALSTSDAQDEQVKKLIKNVLDQVAKLKTSGQPVGELADVLKSTAGLFDKSTDVANYQAKAKTMQGSTSRGMQILGGLMMALGLAVLVAASGILIPSPALAPIVAAATGMEVPGIATAFAGLCFFASGRQKGLASAMNTLANNVKVENAGKADDAAPSPV